MLLARVSSSKNAAGSRSRESRIPPSLRLVLLLFFRFVVSVVAIQHETLEQTTVAEGQQGEEQEAALRDQQQQQQQSTMREQRFLVKSIFDANVTGSNNSAALPEDIQAALQKRNRDAEWYSSSGSTTTHQPPKATS